MKQITKDYVSFETAKLLKEKGFEELCNYEWWIPNNDKRYVLIANGQIKNSNLIDEAYTAPTHQMALKWLREVHKINIVIGVAADDNNLYSLWKFDIWNGNYSIIWGNKREKFNSYEQAVEAALKYTLENLI